MKFKTYNLDVILVASALMLSITGASSLSWGRIADEITVNDASSDSYNSYYTIEDEDQPSLQKANLNRNDSSRFFSSIDFQKVI
jgi:hypothetical protein